MSNRLLSRIHGRIQPWLDEIRIYRRPAHWRTLLRNSPRGTIPDDRQCLIAVLDWLKHAQDVCGDCGGVAGAYSLARGWQGPYPETTGYIIPTFLSAAGVLNDPDLRQRAIRMGDWEIGIQLPDGGVRGKMGVNPEPVVFNTGQVMLGWLALYRETRDERYQQALARAGQWLCDVQEDDGSWFRHTYWEPRRPALIHRLLMKIRGIPEPEQPGGRAHVYHSRVAWSLLATGILLNKPEFHRAAMKNVSWVFSHVRPDLSWISRMGFVEGEHPFSHTVAYTLRGLLECAGLLSGTQRERLLNAVTGCCRTLLKDYDLRYLPGRLTGNRQSNPRFTCLTGNAQLAIVLLKLDQLRPDPAWRPAARQLTNSVLAAIDFDHPCPDIRGAVAGSNPLSGSYMRYTYPNWAAKFLADALLEMISLNHIS